MKTRYFFRRGYLVGAALLVLAGQVLAQVPAFDRAIACGNGPSGYGGPQRMLVDGQGNTYVVGSFTGTVLFGNTLLTAPGPSVPGQLPPSDKFIAKLDAAGSYLWAVQLGGQTYDSVTGLCADAVGNVYLTGYFFSFSITFGSGGPTLYNSSAQGEAFVAKLNGTTRQWQWARRFGGIYDDYGQAIAVNAAGEVFVAGNVLSGTADFGPITLTSFTALNGCWAKLDANGT